MEIYAITQTAIGGTIVACITGLFAWNARMRKHSKEQDMKLAALEQFQANNLNPDATGKRPILSGLEYRTVKLEERAAKQEDKSDSRFRTVMDKLEEIRKEGSNTHRDMEARIEARIDRMIQTFTDFLSNRVAPGK